MVAPTEREKSFTARNGGPAWPEDHFLSPFVQRREMAHQRLFKAESRDGNAVCTLWVHGPTPPCLTLSAGAEPKSKGHYQK